MTLAQLIIKTLILNIVLAILKITFFGWLNVELWAILIIYYLLVMAVSIAIVRRLGAINYLEVFLITLIWLVISSLVDYLIVNKLLEKPIFSDGHFWLSYLAMIFALVVFHKKQHVEVRKSLLNK